MPALAQLVKWAVSWWLKGWWLKSWLQLSACWRVLGQDTEPWFFFFWQCLAWQQPPTGACGNEKPIVKHFGLPWRYRSAVNFFAKQFFPPPANIQILIGLSRWRPPPIAHLCTIIRHRCVCPCEGLLTHGAHHTTQLLFFFFFNRNFFSIQSTGFYDSLTVFWGSCNSRVVKLAFCFTVPVFGHEPNDQTV